MHFQRPDKRLESYVIGTGLRFDPLQKRGKGKLTPRNNNRQRHDATQPVDLLFNYHGIDDVFD